MKKMKMNKLKRKLFFLQYWGNQEHILVCIKEYKRSGTLVKSLFRRCGTVLTIDDIKVNRGI